MAGNFVTPLNARISEAILVPFGAEIPEHLETPDRVPGAEAAEHQRAMKTWRVWWSMWRLRIGRRRLARHEAG